MKKTLILLLLAMLLVGGCSQKKEETSYENITTNTTAPEEVDSIILRRIQSCIQDYNENKIEERSKEINYSIQPLPIAISSLPDINSLDELESLELNSSTTNIEYSYKLSLEDIDVYFNFFNLGRSFWNSGQIVFEAKDSILVENNPEFSTYKGILDDLLVNYENVLYWINGNNLTLAEEESTAHPGYKQVYAMGPYNPTSIQEIKDIAEQVYDTSLLETYYTVSFNPDSPIFIEDNGVLYCANYVTVNSTPNDYSYATNYIVGVRDNGDTVDIDIVKNYYDEIVPEINRIVLSKVNDQYRIKQIYNN